MNERKTVEPGLNALDNAGPNGAVRENGSQSKSTESATLNSDTKPVKELTPEEQMTLYEKELKENDWGHQPC